MNSYTPDSIHLGSWTIRSNLQICFEIKNSQNIFEPSNPTLLEHGSNFLGSRRLVIIDRNICKHYLDKVKNYFFSHQIDCHIVAIDSNESDKNISTLMLLLQEMEDFGILRRAEPIIAIGGGVLLDVVGMAAGIYRRGIPYIRIPTTLVGLIDASIGAKTGINFAVRRNRLGSYYPPIASYLDINFLDTLPSIEISSGLGEALKMAVIKDDALFNLLEENGSDLVSNPFNFNAHANEIINRCVHGMKLELENNLWESDLKRSVDFGHSFSPIIEMRSLEDDSQHPLTHGQAVAIDVIFSSIISLQRSLLTEIDLLRIIKCARSMLLPTLHPLFEEPLLILEALNDTQKHRNGNQNLPLPDRIGSYIFINDLTFVEIKEAVKLLKKYNLIIDEGRTN